MLRELSVQNLAVIEDVCVELAPGFCAWTGETGAGKSLLLGAVSLLLGDRGSTDLIRAGTEELRITGRFELSDELCRLVEPLLPIETEEGEIILSRRLNRSGRSQAYINGQPAPIATLKQIGPLLVDIHGQRESESLLEPAYQLRLLDAFGKLENARKKYLDRATVVRDLRHRFSELSTARQQRQRELALVRFERDELDQAQLQSGELADLIRERERLLHAQSLQTFASESYARLYEEEGSILEQIGKLERQGESWAELDPGLADAMRRFQGLGTEVRDLAETLRDLGQRWENDPERLETVERRLQLLRRLEAKYRRPVDELIVYLAGLDEAEVRLQKEEDDLEAIGTNLTGAFAHMKDAAAELSTQRHKVAKKLASETRKELADLGMPEAKLGAELTPIALDEDPTAADVPADGIDHLELMLAANPGEPALPLRKVASGGELSRTMLALKTVLAGHDRRVTLVFDEIDANVGGRLGDILGEKLAALAKTHQVICVTHLPQVASYASHHWTIRKARRGNRTVTQILPLVDGDRVEELASMLRGEARSETTRKEAAAMLEAATKRRPK